MSPPLRTPISLPQGLTRLPWRTYTHTQQGPEGPNCGGRGREVNSSSNCAPSVYLITTFTLKLLFEAGSTYSSSQIKKQAHRS